MEKQEARIADTEIRKSYAKYSTLLTLIFIAITGLLLRLYRIGKLSFWHDEADTIFSAANNIYIFHPPAYFFLTRLWLPFSNSETSARLLPLSIGFLCIPVTYFLARIIADKQTALIGTILITISPLAIYYSREVRMYSLLHLTSSLSWLLLIKFLQKKTFPWFIGYTLAIVCLLQTHYFAPFVLIGQILAPLFISFRFKSFLAICSAQILAILSLVPRIRSLMDIFSHVRDADFWAKTPSIFGLSEAFQVILTGYESPWWLTYLLGSIFVILLYQGVKHGSPGIRALFLLGAVVPVTLPFITTFFIPSKVFVPRYVSYSMIPLLITSGHGLNNLKLKYLKIGAGVLILSLTSCSLWFHYQNDFRRGEITGVRHRKEFREATEYIVKNYKEGDFVGTTCLSGTGVTWYYLTHKEGINSVHLLDLENRNREDLNRTYNLEGYYHLFPYLDPQKIPEAFSGYRRLWLYASIWDEGNGPEDYHEISRRLISSWLYQHYPVISKRVYDGVDLTLYDLSRPKHENKVP